MNDGRRSTKALGAPEPAKLGWSGTANTCLGNSALTPREMHIIGEVGTSAILPSPNRICKNADNRDSVKHTHLHAQAIPMPSMLQCYSSLFAQSRFWSNWYPVLAISLASFFRRSSE